MLLTFFFPLSSKIVHSFWCHIFNRNTDSPVKMDFFLGVLFFFYLKSDFL